MKINIINYEISNPWILTKIAIKLEENLKKLGHLVTIKKTVDLEADINHHITFHSYAKQISGIHTLMITHIDNIVKLNKIRNDLKSASVGICMSVPTMKELIKLGVPSSKLNFAFCGQDGNFLDRKITLGITTRLYGDGRKREDFFINSLKVMSPFDFKFEIMGFGWENHVKTLRQLGYEVNYFENFDYTEYISLFTRLDYYIYLGNDEGSMGFIDALASGVKTIVQPQGFHLDAIYGITHSFHTSKEYDNIMIEIVKEKHLLQKSVSEWTWENYAVKHLQIWENCISGNYNENELDYTDKSKIFRIKSKLVLAYFKQKLTLIKNLSKRKSFPAGPRYFGPKINK